MTKVCHPVLYFVSFLMLFFAIDNLKKIYLGHEFFSVVMVVHFVNEYVLFFP